MFWFNYSTKSSFYYKPKSPVELNRKIRNFFRLNFMQGIDSVGFSSGIQLFPLPDKFPMLQFHVKQIFDNKRWPLCIPLVASISLSLSLSILATKGIFQQMRSSMKSELPSQTEPFKVKCNKRMKWINAEEVFSTEKLLFRRKESGIEDEEEERERERKKEGKRDRERPE